MAEFEAAPVWREALGRAGISDYDRAMGFTGGDLVNAHRGRSVVRFGGSFFLKRFTGAAAEMERERRGMELLAAGPGPRPVPLAARGRGPRGAFLVTVRPPGALPLPEALAALGPAERRGVVRAVARAVRAMHDRGLTAIDLTAPHVLAAPPDGVFLIDAGRVARRSGRRDRARDLAELVHSLPFGTVPRTDLARFLRAYAPEDARATARAVEARRRRLALRGRHRRGRVVAAPADRAFLAEHGIRTFDDLMRYDGPGARCLRRLPDRENWKVALGGRTFFVKRHRPRQGFEETPAAAEWEAARAFRLAGIRAMRPLAFGEDVARGSTIWVERAPGVPLDDLLREGDVPPGLRRELVLEAAGILRRMRLREMHHRDFYCCHLIADRDAPPGERLTVIDLQRARRKPGLRKRWFVKDAAQLLHSAPRPPISGADVARFLRALFAVPKLGPAEKRFAAKARRKAARI